MRLPLRFRGIISPAVAGFAGCFLLGAVLFRDPGSIHSGTQPIAFNHAKHIANGLSCTDCHTGAKDEVRATLPALDTCMACHAAALGQSKEEEKLRALAAAGTELGWTKHVRVPSHVYFSHRRHVALGKLECTRCHAGMEKLTSPPEQALGSFRMSNCIECHTRMQARTDCNDCHR